MKKQLEVYWKVISTVLAMLVFTSCEEEIKPPQKTFELLAESESGISFSNDLDYDNEFNVYRYRNFYNGGGVAIGDINNDSLPDIYFISNQKSNKLYLNLGNLKFEDITDKALVNGSRPWSTGVSMVDINADGFLDIYVCNSGDLKGENKQNELFINNGDLTFTESAAAYNLDDKGFSTHASFFDYDKDGDLDVYILNNSYQAIGSFNLKKNERPKRDILGGDKLMENVDGKFIDVSEKAGIYGSVIGFGLGVTVGDVNNDGWEDIYVSNDFFERDYLYINNQNGTFSEELENQITSISGASMGADMADINNDGFNDIFVTEMLPSEYERLKTVTTFEDWNKYQLRVNNGYYHQFTRNTFQLNNTNNSFSEIGRFSGVEASDWSWGALLFDMDNDGLKDLFIANGIYRDLTNQDYLNYISNEEVLRSITANNEVDYAKLIEIIPSNKIKNHAYKNLGNLKFENYDASGLQMESFSNGSAYGDLDNDGDLDLVVNNLSMNAFVYKNTTIETKKGAYIKFVLKGEKQNTNAIGTKILIQNANISIENQPVRGFQSSMDVRPNIGLKNSEPISGRITWPSGKVTFLNNIAVNQTITFNEKDAELVADKNDILQQNIFTKSKEQPAFVHKENRFVDFDRDRLLNQMASTEGPKMSMADVNGDQQNDLFIGGSKDSEPVLLLSENGSFKVKEQKAFALNKTSEDAQSTFFDADGDGDQDLYVCSGGVEFSKYSTNFFDRLYLNDGLGNFKLSNQKLPVANVVHSTSTVVASDFDNDGDVDLFVGERIVPLQYGQPCSGFLLQNDGKGNFKDVTPSSAKELLNIGMITDALFKDIDKDGDGDLVVIGEFMGIDVFENKKGAFHKIADHTLNNLKGWWNTIEAADLDNDGDLDFILGNHGLNSRFKASVSKPITLWSKDFDQNGFVDPILTFKADNGKDYPFALRHSLIEQMKGLTKKFPDYESFKDAGISDIFSEKELQESRQLEVNTLSSIIVINNGDFTFQTKELPVTAQLSTIYGIATDDFDKDGDMDIVLGGNLYNVKPEAGRYDATYGVYLENKGNMNFESVPNGKGLKVNGEIRDLIVDQNRLILSRNNDSLVIYNY
ncbi:VCBS repeat-containing protein [Zobellia nedashkovskayae]|uniref:VCBS repeat-containing protein n=1 Tax=Zobellia nedashkovskayae TaxID=2779510 RepID=UPI00188A3901|nr:VCBS repeat-containing protein [Zobellia nedashkovskayae]